MMGNLFWGIVVPGAIMAVSFGLTIYLYYRFSKKD
jgi:TRAP-type C4-dicarboxylate transport system permease large subunit